MGSPGFQLGWEEAEQARARRAQEQEQQRQADLDLLAQTGGLTQEQRSRAIRDVYAQDPSVLRQHVENLFGRLVGRKTQPIQPGDKSMQDFRSIVASGKTPEQVYQEQLTAGNRANLDYDQQKNQEVIDLITKYAPPDQRAALLEDFARKQAGVSSRVSNIPGAAGQPYRTANGLWVRPVQQSDGSIVEQPMPAGYRGPAVKPVMRTIKGHLVLLDPQNGNALRDLGPVGTARITRRETLQPGDDGQMHLVTLTSVTTPDGATIEVQPDETAAPPSFGKGPAPRAQGAPNPAAPGKGPAPRVGGRAPSTGNVVPGFSTLARSKDPLFRADVQAYTRASEDANTTNEAYESAAAAMKNPTPSSDQELIYSWVRANVQGAGRMTQAEFRQAASVGSLPQRAQTWYSRASQGTLTPEIRNMMFADIQRAAQTKNAEVMRLREALQAPPAPRTGEVLPPAGNLPPGWTQ